MSTPPPGLPRLCLASARNDLFFDDAGNQYLDLFSGHGAVWLGHQYPAVTAAVAEQVQRLWLTGGLDSSAANAAREAIESFFPTSHACAALCTTGMEAAEFALRFVRTATGRTDVVGFSGAMHGKSLAMASLSWPHPAGLEPPAVHRLPFVDTQPEAVILQQLAGLLARRTVAALFVEPLHGCGGGHAASPAFYREATRLCREASTLLVYDEILTGFHRTGPLFLFQEHGLLPEVILLGKALANGFPAATVVAERRWPVQAAMLPGSTFAGNPLAAAAIHASLLALRAELEKAPGLVARVEAIEATVRRELAGLAQVGVQLRGRGALWILEIPPGPNMEELLVRIYRRGVCVGHTRRMLRLLPASTIEPAHLLEGCTVVREELRRAFGHD